MNDKKSTKRTLVTSILALVLCISQMGCSGMIGENSGIDEEKIVDMKYELQDVTDSLKFLGRYTVTSDGITCDHSASGIEFCAYIQGEVKIGISVSPRVTPSGSADANTYYTVYIDGIRQEERFHVESQEDVLTIANFEEGGVHTIRILKQTEAQNSLSILKSLEFKGYFEEAPEEKDLLIEFIGDSITCGFGNLCKKGASDSGNAFNQDATQTYAYLTAETLDADHSLVCYSGIGVAKGWPNFLMEEFFEAESYCRDTKSVCERNFTPDIVVINLGTNDFEKGAAESEFMTKAQDLISLVRQTYGNDVKIVWVYNMMGYSMQNYTTEVVNALGGEENGIYICRLPREHMGGGSHPSVAGHIAAAEVLAQFIQEKVLSE